MMEKEQELVLFGGPESWKAEDWTASDDRVRGGSSQSYLDTSKSSARFYGTLDITTLGGAGFASQRTTALNQSWDLSSYAGIRLDLGKQQDGQKYTLTLKDEILSPNPDNGREQSTISYEYDFTASGATARFVPWHALRPTYRGKQKDDAEPLNTKKVKRFSILMRSFFGEQEGDFLLEIESIQAVSAPSDFEKGIIQREDGVGKSQRRKPWSWKDSNLVGLAVILFSTWAICLGYYKFRGYETGLPIFDRWLLTGSRRNG